MTILKSLLCQTSYGTNSFLPMHMLLFAISHSLLAYRLKWQRRSVLMRLNRRCIFEIKKNIIFAPIIRYFFKITLLSPVFLKNAHSKNDFHMLLSKYTICIFFIVDFSTLSTKWCRMGVKKVKKKYFSPVVDITELLSEIILMSSDVLIDGDNLWE